MLLFRTICTTDWKSRPDHGLIFLGRGTKEELVVKIAKDVADWQANDLVSDAMCDYMNRDEETPEGFEERHKAELTVRPDLGTIWELPHRRWEMRIEPDRQTGERQFVNVDHEDGYRCTIVYHLEDERDFLANDPGLAAFAAAGQGTTG